MQVFSSERKLEHLVGAVMCERNGHWSASRYFAYDKMQELYDEGRNKEPEAPGRPLAVPIRRSLGPPSQRLARTAYTNILDTTHNIYANALLMRPRNRRFGFPWYSAYFSLLAILANQERRSFCLLFAACLA